MPRRRRRRWRLIRKVRWIVGGQAKAETLGDTAKHLDHVVAAYTIGEAGPMFARLLREAGRDRHRMRNA